jgi:prepilin-type N-terminal cleavage/methylation domain-containing protein
MNGINKKNKGFTLIELSVGLGILSSLTIVIYSVAFGTFRSAKGIDDKVLLQQQGRAALSEIVRNLRMADDTTIQTAAGNPIGNAPVTSIVFRRPVDTNGNGMAIDNNGAIEWSNNITYTVNAGITARNLSLVRLDNGGNIVKNFTNFLSPVANSGDFYDAPNGGIEFVRANGGIQITMILQKGTGTNENIIRVRLDEFVTPRN